MGVLRVLLALSVVLSHVGGFFGNYLAGGFASVEMFYIISGFYMATILTEKYDPKRDIGIFYSNRFLRIYSIYFLSLLISLAAYAVIYLRGHGGWIAYVGQMAPTMTWAGKAWLIFTNIFIFGQETTLFMKFDGGHLVFTPAGPGGPTPLWLMMPVPQAWSISLELMFYCLVPFLIRNTTRVLVIIAAATFVLRAAIYHAGYDIDPWVGRFFPLELGLFVMGMLARRIYDAYIGVIERNVQIVVVAVFLSITCILMLIFETLETHHIASMIYAVWPYHFLALIALPCLFQLTRYSKLDNAIGNFSYPVYMVHWIVLMFYEAFAERFQWPPNGSWIKTVSCVSVTFFLAWLIVTGVEVPLDHYRQRRIARAAARAHG